MHCFDVVFWVQPAPAHNLKEILIANYWSCGHRFWSAALMTNKTLDWVSLDEDFGKLEISSKKENNLLWI